MPDNINPANPNDIIVDPPRKHESHTYFDPMTPPARVARLSIKPAPFWQPNPALWFMQLEAQFFRCGITQDETKFYTAVAEIESFVLMHANDIIAKPPTVDKYETLKKRLVDQFEIGMLQ